MLVSFFGASVTQQKNGYVDIFTKLCDNIINVKKYGYGSMHISDAGICFINNVINDKPNYCFIDWFSTGFINADGYIKQFIDTIVLKLIEIDCVPIFLFLDGKDMCSKRLDMYNYVINCAKQNNVDYLSMFNNENIDELLRDSVHTTELGANYYGNTIYNQFISCIMNKKANTIIKTNMIKNDYYDIKLLNINETIYDSITLYGNAKVIGIYQKIGPYSGIVDVIDADNNIVKHTIWDQWCNYERNKIILSFNVKNKATIKIINDEFDTSSCKHNIDWLSYEKKMEIIDIFYVGCVDRYIINT